MFKFDFDLESDDIENQTQEHTLPLPEEPATASVHIEAPFSEIPISQLLDSLPSLISYSPLSIPITTSGNPTQVVTLARRDLFDARFQLISEGAGDELTSHDAGIRTKEQAQSLSFLDAPSDLIPKVYEGGLKTWECSLDLVDYLDGNESGHATGKRVLEIGCGTAVPTLYLLQKIFSAPPPPSNAEKTHFHVQDYNASVLELVTLPNMILAWYMSPASTTYRTSLDPKSSEEEDQPSADPSVSSNLSISSALKSAFQASLEDYHIDLRFFAGSWGGFDVSLTGGRYDIVLTSETIYRQDGLDALIRLMRAACGGPSGHDGGLGEVAQQKLSLDSADGPASSSYMCLVAAKVLYFGVGGGVSEFVRAVEGTAGKGNVKTVWEKRAGVGRTIMQVEWK